MATSEKDKTETNDVSSRICTDSRCRSSKDHERSTTI